MFKGFYVLFLVLVLISVSDASAIEAGMTEYPLTIMDNMNNTITIESKPEKILSTMPSNTEILFAIGAGDNVVGGTIHDKYPPEVANIPKVGGYTNLEFESIVSLEPDVIFASAANGEDAINMLKDLGLTVIVIEPKTIDDIMNNIELIGEVTGNKETALSITDDMRTQMDAITSKTEDIPTEDSPRVLYLIWHDPMYSAGLNSYPDDLITMAGGNNIQKAEGWPVINLEDVIASNPQIIICSGMGGGSYTILDAIKNNDALAQTDAIKNNKVYPIDQPSIIEIPGPRIVEGLNELYGYIEPEIKVGEEQTEDEAPVNSTPGFSVMVASCMLVAGYLRAKRS
ncbi:ABC transporter substrate-binding protein [Methanococcoides sp.]|jgi:iron complex transport system substrate-binding protein|uniref:ABC transporter substrate-binding protein n=1 Tax=Methanococcoides sp. TaxID=1966350 RepID=UPI0019E9FA74|nr:cobalamin-binding protein [Methanococcoides sp.]NOQ48606.1 ABC transporter substrate-binding protein [Methanococcoides sp.]